MFLKDNCKFFCLIIVKLLDINIRNKVLGIGKVLVFVNRSVYIEYIFIYYLKIEYIYKIYYFSFLVFIINIFLIKVIFK